MHRLQLRLGRFFPCGAIGAEGFDHALELGLELRIVLFPTGEIGGQTRGEMLLLPILFRLPFRREEMAVQVQQRKIAMALEFLKDRTDSPVLPIVRSGM